MWPEVYPADAHDALPSCLVKCAQSLGQLVFATSGVQGAIWPEVYSADAHDAPLLPRQVRAVTGAVGFYNIWSPGGHVSGSIPSWTQLMPMMLPSSLVKCAQSLGQLVFTTSGVQAAMWPEVYPADAHDAALLPRQMRAVTGAVGFCNIWSPGGHVAGSIPS